LVDGKSGQCLSAIAPQRKGSFNGMCLRVSVARSRVMWVEWVQGNSARAAAPLKLTVSTVVVLMAVSRGQPKRSHCKPLRVRTERARRRRLRMQFTPCNVQASARLYRPRGRRHGGQLDPSHVSEVSAASTCCACATTAAAHDRQSRWQSFMPLACIHLYDVPLVDTLQGTTSTSRAMVRVKRVRERYRAHDIETSHIACVGASDCPKPS